MCFILAILHLLSQLQCLDFVEIILYSISMPFFASLIHLVWAEASLQHSPQMEGTLTCE